MFVSKDILENGEKTVTLLTCKTEVPIDWGSFGPNVLCFYLNVNKKKTGGQIFFKLYHFSNIQVYQISTINSS